jgi:hypothetical protein
MRDVKILASPFEPNRDSGHEAAPLDAAERARLDQAAHVDEVTPPAATTEIQAGLNSATRESLSRLALLIRDQMKSTEPVLEETVKPAARRRNSGGGADGHDDRREEQEHQRDEAMTAFAAKGLGDLLHPQALPPDAFPAVVRLERRFKQTARERGFRIYSRQKKKDAVHNILSELGDHSIDPNLESALELLSGVDSSDRRRAA